MGSLNCTTHLDITVARTSITRCVVRDEPGRADILLGSNLLCDSKQKDEQKVPVQARTLGGGGVRGVRTNRPLSSRGPRECMQALGHLA